MAEHFRVELPKEKSSIIKVIGVGGGGGNAVNHMYNEGINGVDFFICNTDNQALEKSPVPNKIHIGTSLTEGRGAGSNPEVGKKAAEESVEEIIEALGINTQMLFVTAGMGGGTGTGAAPVVAQAAKQMGILTVGIVTTPFNFEGSKRKKQAEEGINELRDNVDSLLVISNDRIKDIFGNLVISKAFAHADNVLTTAARGIAEIITIAGSVNVDFEDVKTAMKDSGVAILGTGVSEGDDRAMRAAETALNSPLLNDNKIKGASDLLINISYGKEEATMEEFAEINQFFQDQAGQDANLKCGLCYDENLNDKISVTIIATGFNRSENAYIQTDNEELPENVEMEVDTAEEDGEGDEDLTVNRQITIDHAIQAGNDEERIRSLLDRNKYLRDLKERTQDKERFEEMEKQPAFKRKGVSLDDVTTADGHDISRVSLVDEPNKKPEIRSNNSYLHDNVD